MATIVDESLKEIIRKVGKLKENLDIYSKTLSNLEKKLAKQDLQEWKRNKYLRQVEQITKKIEEVKRDMSRLFDSIEIKIKTNVNGNGKEKKS